MLLFEDRFLQCVSRVFNFFYLSKPNLMLFSLIYLWSFFSQSQHLPVSYRDAFYHLSCFACIECGTLLFKYLLPSSSSSHIRLHYGLLYCRADFDRLYGPSCVNCTLPISLPDPWPYSYFEQRKALMSSSSCSNFREVKNQSDFYKKCLKRRLLKTSGNNRLPANRWTSK